MKGLSDLDVSRQEWRIDKNVEWMDHGYLTFVEQPEIVLLHEHDPVEFSFQMPTAPSKLKSNRHWEETWKFLHRPKIQMCKEIGGAQFETLRGKEGLTKGTWTSYICSSGIRNVFFSRNAQHVVREVLSRKRTLIRKTSMLAILPKGKKEGQKSHKTIPHQGIEPCAAEASLPEMRIRHVNRYTSGVVFLLEKPCKLLAYEGTVCVCFWEGTRGSMWWWETGAWSRWRRGVRMEGAVTPRERARVACKEGTQTTSRVRSDWSGGGVGGVMRCRLPCGMGTTWKIVSKQNTAPDLWRQLRSSDSRCDDFVFWCWRKMHWHILQIWFGLASSIT